jgi:NAD+ synthase (glutamine-hydrolysing)
MSNIKVGAASLNQTPLDWERNKKNVIDALYEAKREGVKILCLPEMAITGYGCEDHFLSEAVRDSAWDVLQDLLPCTEGIFTCFGVPYLLHNALYNVMVCVYDKEIIGIVPKQHLAGDGLHYEPRWFKPWPSGIRTTTPIRGQLSKGLSLRGAPMGDFIFNIDGVNIGFEICEDAFVAERPGNALAKRGVDIILNPSASHFAFGKRVTRERLVVEGSRAFNVTYIYANLLGNEAGRAIYDGDCLIANCGDLLARGPYLNMKRVNLTTAVIDLAKTTTKIVSTASFSPNLEANGMIRCGGKLANSEEKVTKPVQDTSITKHEEFTNAITLGLFDYLEKSHSKGFVVSLSGGADSAACAVLVDIMFTRAASELGLQEACNRIGLGDLCHGANYKDPSDCKKLMSKLLTCVYQSTSNSSKVTLKAARDVAKQLGAKFKSISIDSIVKRYTALAEQVEGRPLTWDKDDLALQNIQARARAPGIWMVANLEGKLLITTSNRSEAAVGYCTMDGDTAGSIAPIGGIDKAFLLEWLTAMVTTYSSLKGIVVQKPTAELRPGQGQTDEEDLMPYTVLDAIETWAILEKKGPQEVLDCLRRERTDITNPLAVSYVKKFFTLWSRNQWKRIKFSPSLHCDNHSLEADTWCRFPLLSGGFTAEITALK